MTTRTGKTATGSHEYRLTGNYYATRMGDGSWYIFEKKGTQYHDTGHRLPYPARLQGMGQKNSDCPARPHPYRGAAHGGQTTN
jgi:hypothetical protein